MFLVVCLWSRYSKNAFDMITQSELLTQNISFSHSLANFIVKWAVCLASTQYNVNDVFKQSKKTKSQIFQPETMWFSVIFYAIPCWENRQSQHTMYNMQHINGSPCVCRFDQWIRCIIRSEKCICVISILRTEMQRPNIQLTHIQLYDYSDFYAQQTDL